MSTTCNFSKAAAALLAIANRTDAYGGYRADGRVYTGKNGIDAGRIERHLGGTPGACIGLHAIAPDGTTRFGAVDVDAHDGRPKEDAEREAFGIYERMSEVGLEPVLEDSSGGFHIWAFPAEPVSAAALRALLQRLAPGAEVFPKQDRIEADDFGNWLRLPGRHPKLGSWSRVWCRHTRAWLDWPHALESFIDARRFDPAILPDVETMPPPRARPDGTEDLAAYAAAEGGTDRVERCLAYLSAMPNAVSGQRGHDATFAAARAIFKFGLDGPEARAALDWYNEHKCRPPWSAKELLHKLTDARASVMAKGDFGAKLLDGRHRAKGKAPEDFAAAGVVLVVEDARATETRWSATVRVVDAKTGADLGSFPVTTSPTGLHAAERELMRLLKDLRRAYGIDDDAALRRTLRSALDRKNLEEIARREEAEELRSRPRQWGRDPIVDLVAGHLGATLSPAFAGTKGKAWSETQGRTVEKSDLGVTTALLAKIADGDEFLGKLAAKKGLLALKQLAENALDVAWSDILRTLPDEIGAALGPQSKAAEAVRRQVVRAFHVTETWRKELRKDNDGKDREHIERASAATRTLGLKLGKVWIRVLPGCDVWARIDSKGRTRWGIRFSFVNGTQLKGSAKAPVCIERACDQAALTRLLKNYGMLDESGDPPDRLTGGGRIAVLSPELCDEILGHEQTACDPGTGEVREDGGAR